MTSSLGVLDFFVVEATEYVDRLDALLATEDPAGPDAAEFLRHARSLRGSATMAKQYGIARVAAALERTARALRDGSIRWDAAVSAIFIAAVENLKILIRNVRAWTPADEQRVQARAAELERLAPGGASRATPAGGTPGATFVVSETAALADALEQLVATPDERESLPAVLDQVRALRGVAAVRDLPAVAEAVDAVERVAKSLHLGAPSASPQQLSLFAAASGVLRRVSGEIAAGRRVDTGAPELERFHAALAALAARGADAERIVPIAELFYDDGGPTIVSTSPAPPTTAAERFRLEVVSHAEHLRRIVNDARAAGDSARFERCAAELRGALERLQRTAESFGETSVSRFVSGWSERMFTIDARALSALDGAAALLANPAAGSQELSSRLRQLDPGGGAPVDAGQPGSAVAETRVRTPAGDALYRVLEEGIAAFARLGEVPLGEPARIPQDEVVPIEHLLYRGASAFRRALELRDEIRRSGRPATPDAVSELLDLLDLTVTEPAA